ncbi:MAG: hypothetical protein ABSC42_10790 [Tepidisphaeraceae bacterium]
MTTLLKIEANRQNAMVSTGPQTAEGKAIVSGNAIRHGLLSWKPTIPGLETVEDWDAHLDRTLESLAPVGYAEILLAERAALLLWRLSRVARYEREATAVALEHAEARKRTKLENAEQSISKAHVVVALAGELRTLPPETELDPDAAANALAKAADEASVDLYEDEGIEWPGYVQSCLDEVDWTAARLLECLEMVAARAGVVLDELLADTTRAVGDTLKEAQQKRDKLLADFDRERRGLLLPDTPTLEKVNRYETTLERSLFKALHELERRQAARDGQAVPLPMAVDVNVSGAAQE